MKQIQNPKDVSNYYNPKNHTWRINIAIFFNLGIVAVVTVSIALLYYNTTSRNMDDTTFLLWLPWLVLHVLW